MYSKIIYYSDYVFIYVIGIYYFINMFILNIEFIIFSLKIFGI